MELKITTQQILKLLQVLTWIIFIGLCVEAGGIIFNAIFTLYINPANANYFWEGVSLSSLYHEDHGHFMVITLLMAIVTVLKAILFYLLVKLFVTKKLSISRPFSIALKQFLLKVSYLVFGIGLFTHSGYKYSKWLSERNVDMPDPQSLHFGGADVWFFMTVILVVITQIVKRGIEIQNENDLTI